MSHGYYNKGNAASKTIRLDYPLCNVPKKTPHGVDFSTPCGVQGEMVPHYLHNSHIIRCLINSP